MRKVHLPTTLCLVLSGCWEQELELGREDGGTAEQTDAGEPPVDDGGVLPPACLGVGKLDILFVIDNSRSMYEEQQQLAVEIPRLARILSSGDIDGDGKREFAPAADMHLGVVTSDLGNSGFESALHACRSFGDDGLLVSATRTWDASQSCSGFRLPSAPYLSVVPGQGHSPEQLAQDFSCLAMLGTEGCGFEQQLEAMYKALAPSSVRFGNDTGGHGDGFNAGFLRSDATLVVVQISDEEDCSVTDRGVGLFQKDNTSADVLLPDGSPLGINVRCALNADNPELVHVVDRYVEGLKALKPEHPENIVFAALVGIPTDAEGQSFDDILAHPSMQYRADPDLPTGGDLSVDLAQLAPACTRKVGDVLVTRADPGKRFVAAAKGFGENGIVRSICAEDYTGALGDVIDRVAAISRACTAP